MDDLENGTAGVAVSDDPDNQNGAAEAPGDYDGPRGTGDLPVSLVEALKTVCRAMDKRELSARIDQVAKAQKARFFWRGIQFLNRAQGTGGTEGATGTVYTPMSPEEMDDDDKQYAFNIYKGYGKSFVATFAQAPAGVRFEPNDMRVASDVAAAHEAESARKLICKVNNQKEIQRQIAVKAWTDGLVVLYSYACEHPKYGTIDDKPRTYPEIEVGGSLEWKVPIASGDFDKWDYVRRQKEVAYTVLQGDYPDKAEKITPGSGAKDIDYSRQARVSVAEGLGIVSQTGDALAFNVTETTYWLRPSAFNELPKDSTAKSELLDYFPNGCRVCFAGDEYVRSCDESMDDHIKVFKAVDQDGYNLNGVGYEIIGPQECFNDGTNLAHVTFVRGVPHSFTDQKLVPPEARKGQKSTPGCNHAVERPVGEPLQNCFYQEQPAEAPQTLIAFLDNVQGPLTQFLSGQQPALFGGEMGEAGKTASGYQQALAQAMGLMGLVWVPFKVAWAGAMRDCVRILGKSYPQGTQLSSTSSENNGDESTITINVDNLAGEFLCYPDTDENFPQTWTAKRAAFAQLFDYAQKNVALMQVLSHPDNLRLGKDLLGIPDLTIPGADSDEKQQQEIEDMEKQPPVPNPQAMAVARQAQASGVVPQGAESIPPLVSSVPIDPDCDDHAAEFATCLRWINSPAGQKAKRKNPEWFQNVRLHAMEHKQMLQQNQAQAQKPPSESINFKDMPPEGQAQMAAQAGIHLDPAQLAAQQQAEAAQAALNKTQATQ